MTIAVTLYYTIEIVKCTKKEMLLTEQLEKIQINNMINKENI